ncbi:MAG: type II toxin-antitoxin system VapC family toxin [Thermoleophilia bacterium]|nr:type II toxin-antitoxin system VapC family toxin [Thermoleophilia bacterium]
MSVYFDTSSFVKLVLAEDGSREVQRAWDSAEARVASVALIAESRAAIAAARRDGRVDPRRYSAVIEDLVGLWHQINGIILTEELAVRAGELAVIGALRGYDAIHLASAEAILDDGDVMVVSDTRLAEAAASIGIEALVPAEA